MDGNTDEENRGRKDSRKETLMRKTKAGMRGTKFLGRKHG